ncbi:undecaprenyl/decaprenyl-phosphate alpha-N-acetylglucosaminyl 1-phosphate transferase [Corynebacterium sp. 320]|uniref:Undecaprenyl/decaprenyl-phosphate alpha-N-acetylglucosaminyl 1-phosphate transferase n=2 Tax=Corynebacteriaceae TaxID=1653 RepID=A0ABQ6VGU8_9CORY|nr:MULTISPECIES: MraY family glycosyltransferase [Corynebacterium]KAB1504539.1 undecaprenyl/decaprenyl-phosphate alpha-N-acetylglucosaminyl 1-phosphate transferase [Corynebacterium sp. 320]KAB1553400.1 undecaprenyl/decaprenyl-phosphate alpha-N-acetylglucosaminyl 1-phosphate transferase [Corynebacterium sp. 321]KAB1554490.1 undecaprenyl/decaprenyl-phosphate alpha-N-acetylglucosaminyl 1-phosphate transferase [Corynebacterium sp. 319]KAB3523649.1 undecaprenyl/decaprenyl-phosphate alpha-N-acetylglu
MGVGVPLRELGLVLLLAGTVTYLVTGIVRHIMVRYGRMEAPRDRDVHSTPTPRLGGVAMFTGLIVSVVVAAQLPALNRGFPPVTPDMAAVIMAAFVIVVVGILDDLYDIAWWLKLGGQVVGAVVMSLMGLSWYLLALPFGDGTTLVLDQVQSTILTALLTVTIVNAMNFVDGLDGLAAGLGLIAASTILLYSLTILYDQGGTVSAYPPAIISAALAGMCMGFLPHNFSPARIFMGDSGSMLIGLLLSAACVSASGRINMSLFGAADMFALMSPVIVVVAALSIPLLDLLMAVVRRLAAGKSPFAPDKEHLHHRLLRLGHSQKQVVLVLYAWVAVVAFVAIGSTIFPTGLTLVIFGVSLLAVLAITVIPQWSRLNNHERTQREHSST